MGLFQVYLHSHGLWQLMLFYASLCSAMLNAASSIHSMCFRHIFANLNNTVYEDILILFFMHITCVSKCYFMHHLQTCNRQHFVSFQVHSLFMSTCPQESSLNLELESYILTLMLFMRGIWLTV